MRISTILAGTLSLALAQATHAATLDTYFVGNSLTWDANPPGIASASATAGHSMAYGHHIQCGARLQTIWDTPSVCVPSPAPYGEAHAALANHHWDAVTLQPFYDSLAGAKQAINGFMGLAPAAGTRYLVYSAWPSGYDPTPGTPDYTSPSDVQIDFQAEWDKPLADNTMTRAFSERLVTDLRAEHPGVSIDMIPVGDVLYELDQRLAASPVGEINSVAQLYRDAAHMGYDGRALAAMTFYATLFGQHPSTADFSHYNATPAMVPLLQDTVWDVVSSHDFTSVPEPGSLVILAVVPFILCGRRSARRFSFRALPDPPR